MEHLGIEEGFSGKAYFAIRQAVQTDSGSVNGHAAPNVSDVSEYLRIPFAMPPIGYLRFAPPQKYNGTSVVKGTNYVVQPVMGWIYGGGFTADTDDVTTLLL